MSIYIKGMEMPTTCFECPFMFARRYCCADLTLDLYQGDYDELKSRVDGCPLVPVPEHGRLIDADALHKELCALEYVRENEWLDGVREARGVDAARVALLDAHTIIPADKEVRKK